jgi:hypothetical protein
MPIAHDEVTMRCFPADTLAVKHGPIWRPTCQYLFARGKVQLKQVGLFVGCSFVLID